MPMQADTKTVGLKDGRSVILRRLASGDTDRLHAFFVALPEEDRNFLRHDVCDRELVRTWVEKPDLKHKVTVVALDGADIVGYGALRLTTHGWSQHVGLFRLITAVTHRHVGLGRQIAREIVGAAEERGLEKLQARALGDDRDTIRLFEALGFERVAAIKDVAKDQQGRNCSLVVMLTDVSNLDRVLEDWVQDTMIPAFRAPGAGEE